MGAQQSPQQVAAALQAKYDKVRDFTADFTQQYQSGILRKKSTQRGKLQVKKPGKMRWDYTAPEKKLFVSDGSRDVSVHARRQPGHDEPVPAQDEATTAVLFLTGKGNLSRDFTVSSRRVAPAGTYGLRLQPKLQERDYDWLELRDRSTVHADPLADGRRPAGRAVDVPLLELQGKRRTGR